MKTEKYKDIKVNRKGFIEEIILSRPLALNALSKNLISELLEEIRRVEKDETIRLVVLKSGINKAFCVGADLKERAAFRKKDVKSFLGRLNDITNRIEDSRLIYIAEVNGYAMGGGLEIVLACDFCIATKNSIFSLPEVKIGVIPGAGGTARIIEKCGLNKGKEIVLLGDQIKAEKALEYGIVNEVVKNEDELERSVIEYIEKLKRCAPLSLSYAKKCLNFSFKKYRNEVLKHEKEHYKKLIDTKDRKEGIRAFFEKRKAKFKGK